MEHITQLESIKELILVLHEMHGDEHITIDYEYVSKDQEIKDE